MWPKCAENSVLRRHDFFPVPGVQTPPLLRHMRSAILEDPTKVSPRWRSWWCEFFCVWHSLRQIHKLCWFPRSFPPYRWFYRRGGKGKWKCDSGVASQVISRSENPQTRSGHQDYGTPRRAIACPQWSDRLTLAALCTGWVMKIEKVS